MPRRYLAFTPPTYGDLWFLQRRGAYMAMRESPQGMEASVGCAAGDGMGGGIFAKTAKIPPPTDPTTTRMPKIPIKRRGTPRRYVLREMELLD